MIKSQTSHHSLRKLGTDKEIQDFYTSGYFNSELELDEIIEDFKEYLDSRTDYDLEQEQKLNSYGK